MCTLQCHFCFDSDYEILWLSHLYAFTLLMNIYSILPLHIIQILIIPLLSPTRVVSHLIICTSHCSHSVVLANLSGCSRNAERCRAETKAEYLRLEQMIKWNFNNLSGETGSFRSRWRLDGNTSNYNQRTCRADNKTQTKGNIWGSRLFTNVLFIRTVLKIRAQNTRSEM